MHRRSSQWTVLPGIFRLRRAFSLVELLVVISIISLLIAVLLPVLQSARATAQMSVSLSNLRQLTIAHHAYTNDYNGTLIPLTYAADESKHDSNGLRWNGALVRYGYVTSRRVFWSPARNTSNLDMQTTSTTNNDPWKYTGYGMNKWVSGPLNYTRSGTTGDPPNPMNLNRFNAGKEPKLSEFMLMVETWSDTNKKLNIAGVWEAETFRGDSTNWTRCQIFTYQGRVARSFLDGHALGTNSEGADGVYWVPYNAYDGLWASNPILGGSSSHEKRAPWFCRWWL